MFSGSKSKKWIIGVSAVLAAVLGVVMIVRGAALVGYDRPGFERNSVAAAASVSETAKETTGAAAVETNAALAAGSDVQYITSTLTSNGYPDITVQNGIPVEWTLHADEGMINGCNGVMVISAYGLEVQLKEGDNLIKFTPTETGTITYSCWMGMITGHIQVDGNAVLPSGQAPADTTDGTSPAPSQGAAAGAQEIVPAGGCCAAV